MTGIPGGEHSPHSHEPVMEISRLTVRFGGVVALDGVDITLPAGQVTGVIGPNGAGKTTLYNVICGFVKPQSGQIVWRGRPLLRHRPRQMAGLGIGRTLQDLGLFTGLSVVENVLVGAGTRARTGLTAALFALPRTYREETRLRAAAVECLDRLGIAELAERRITDIDHGAQKRVALARALLGAPELLMLDEPAAGLSSAEIQELADLLPGLPCTVVVVEHHMDFVMSVCHNVVVLDFGKVIATGTPAQVRGNPAVIAAYLGGEADGDA